MTQATTDKPAISRGTFLKGVAATAAAVAAPGMVANVAQAQGRIEAPYVKKSPSGEILVWVTLPFTDGQIAAFEKAYPHVKVKQQQTAYVPNTPSLTEKLITGIGVPDAIYFIEDAYMGQYADALYDVSSYVEPYASKITPFKLAVAKQNGRMVAVPWDVDPAFLIYRTDIVAKAGVDVSRIRTYDDLIAAAKQVKSKVPSCTTPLCFNQTPAHLVFTLEGLAWQQHTGMANTKGELQLNTTPYTKAFTYFEKVGKAGLATIVPWSTPTLYNAWNKGQTCFMHFADWWTHWNAPGLKPIWGKVGLAYQPVLEHGNSPFSMMGGSAMVVPLKAKRPDLGALFSTFIMFSRASLEASNVRTKAGVLYEYEAILPAAEQLWPDVHLRRAILAPSVRDREHEMLSTAARGAPATYRYPGWYSRTIPYLAPIITNLLTGKTSAKDAQAKAYHDVLTKVVQRYR